MKPADPQSILIVKPSSLGDIVHTLPAAALVKHAWPEAKLRWLINPEWAPLLEGNPHINEVIPFPRRDFRGVRGALRIAPWARTLRERMQADLVLDFQGLLRSALIAKLCRSENGRIVGLSDAREGARFFYDAVADVSGQPHAVDRYLALVEALGIAPPAEEPLSWPLPTGTEPTATKLPPRFVLLHPFARGPGKSLTDADVETFCRGLAPTPVVIAGRAERAVPKLEHVIDLLNRTTLHELIFTIRRARFIVSVDSGPMHIAAALSSRVVAIHTWSVPEKVGPYSRAAWVWKDGALFHRGESARRSAPDIGALAEFVRAQM